MVSVVNFGKIDKGLSKLIFNSTSSINVSEKISGSKIRNSNGHQLIAQTINAGAEPKYYGIIPDSEKTITNVITRALSENEIVLISGGVSMGDYDFVPMCLRKNGINILFDKVAVQPGKPVNFGMGKNKACFGMPGNPVSTFIQFEFLVRPFIVAMMGGKFKPAIFPMTLGQTLIRRNDTREAIIPVKIDDGKVFPVEYHGSAHINAIAISSYVISIPQGIKEIPQESIVNVRQIQ